MQAGTTKVLQFYVGERDGGRFVIEKKIPSDERDYKVYDSNGEVTDLIKLTARQDGRMAITPDDSIGEDMSFSVVYTFKIPFECK